VTQGIPQHAVPVMILARLWYLNWEFEFSPSDPFHLFLRMKDIEAMV
jgi:hypothetical protein